jgi:hypothetical protein
MGVPEKNSKSDGAPPPELIRNDLSIDLTYRAYENTSRSNQENDCRPFKVANQQAIMLYYAQ